MKRQAYVRKSARVEMIPLIDSLFLLLVFFIYIMLSMVVHRGIPLDLPRVDGDVSPDKRDYIGLSIDKDGGYFLNQTQLSLSDLNAELQKHHESNGDMPLYISADKNVKYDFVLQALHSVQKSPFAKIYFETSAPQPDESLATS